MVENYKLIELLSLIPAREAVIEKLNELSYLVLLSDEVLWDFYHECIEKCISSNTVPDLDEDNKNLLIRLKFRALEAKMTNIQEGGPG